MTVKQIAEATSKPEKTVRTWAKKTAAKMASIEAKIAASSSMYPPDYDIEETCAIIETGLGKNAANLYRLNAKSVSVPLVQIDNAPMMAKIAEALGAIAVAMENLSGRVAKVESAIDAKQILLPQPEMDARSAINKAVRDYATKHQCEYRDAWRELYRDFGYRTHSNPSIAAKNRNMTVIDYIESECQLETLLSVALSLK